MKIIGIGLLFLDYYYHPGTRQRLELQKQTETTKTVMPRL
jgi:hypothetical protein